MVHRFEPADKAARLGPHILQLRGLLALGLGQCGLCANGGCGHLSVSRYDNRSCRSDPDIWFGGMRQPGLMACAFMIQPPRLPMVFGNSPAAIVFRLAMWVKSGPTRDPAGVPRMVWHITHACVRNTCWPCALCGVLGGTELCACWSSHC